MEASQQWGAIVELYKTIREEDFVRADKGILQLVMRASKARVREQQPDLALSDELYRALHRVRALPVRPTRVDSQHIQVRVPSAQNPGQKGAVLCVGTFHR